MIRQDISRRSFIAATAGAVALQASRGFAASDQAPIPLALTLREIPAANGTAWVFDPSLPKRVLRFDQGARIRVNFSNALKLPVLLNGYGFDGLAALEPLLVQPVLDAGKSFAFDLPLNESGTFALDARLLGDGSQRPLPIAALTVTGSNQTPVDQDHLLLLEDARLREDGTAIAPGADALPARVSYTINGRPDLDIPVKAQERIMFRFINGCHRNAIAIQFANHDVRAVAFDSRSAEPFAARNGRLVLAPGARIDAILDATEAPGSASPILLFDGSGPRQIARLVYSADPPIRPQFLPLSRSPSAPALRLDFPSALRADIELGLSGGNRQSTWLSPLAMAVERGAPAFRIKRGRTAILTLKNSAAKPIAFRLHGHHFRWLDRLDDGWKPFLLDTMLLDVGQTERIAFLAQYAGAWLMESAAVEWSAPKLVRWFAVD